MSAFVLPPWRPVDALLLVGFMIAKKRDIKYPRSCFERDSCCAVLLAWCRSRSLRWSITKEGTLPTQKMAYFLAPVLLTKRTPIFTSHSRARKPTF